jgi:hypothetical protein
MVETLKGGPFWAVPLIKRERVAKVKFWLKYGGKGGYFTLRPM